MRCRAHIHTEDKTYDKDDNKPDVSVTWQPDSTISMRVLALLL